MRILSDLRSTFQSVCHNSAHLLGVLLFLFPNHALGSFEEFINILIVWSYFGDSYVSDSLHTLTLQ